MCPFLRSKVFLSEALTWSSLHWLGQDHMSTPQPITSNDTGNTVIGSDQLDSPSEAAASFPEGHVYMLSKNQGFVSKKEVVEEV